VPTFPAALEVTSVPIKRINAYCAEPKDVEKQASTTQLIVDTARIFPLKTLDVCITIYGPDACTEDEDVIFTGAAVKLLKSLVDSSMEKELAFQVFNEGLGKKCELFGPGNSRRGCIEVRLLDAWI
jgi:hypothetical protein